MLLSIFSFSHISEKIGVSFLVSTWKRVGGRDTAVFAFLAVALMACTVFIERRGRSLGSIAHREYRSWGVDDEKDKI